MIMHKSLKRCNPNSKFFSALAGPIFQAHFESLFLMDTITLSAVERTQCCVVKQ